LWNSSAHNLSLPETTSLLDVTETEEEHFLKLQLFELYTEFAQTNQEKIDQLLDVEQNKMTSLQSEQSLLIEEYAKSRLCRKTANITSLHTKLTRAHTNYVHQVQADRQKLAQWQNEQRTHMWNRVLDVWNGTNSSIIQHDRQQQLLAEGWDRLFHAVLGFTLIAGNILPAIYLP
jgi:hypothetical protein